MQLPIKELVSRRSEQRKFGVVMGIAFCLIACVRWWLRGHPPFVLFGLGTAFLVLGLLAPMVLRPVFYGWLKFAEGLNWVMTRVTLTVAFYLIITPTALLYRLISGDPLKRSWDPDAETYWEPPDDQPAELDAYKQQF